MDEEVKLNALGEPSPNRTDFKLWSRENLEAFARQAADENLVLRDDIRLLRAAWRKAVAQGSDPPTPGQVLMM